MCTSVCNCNICTKTLPNLANTFGLVLSLSSRSMMKARKRRVHESRQLEWKRKEHDAKEKKTSKKKASSKTKKAASG